MQFYSSRWYKINIWNNLTLLGRSCLSWKPQWTRLAATGSFVQRSPKPLPWVLPCPLELSACSTVSSQSTTAPTCLPPVVQCAHVWPRPRRFPMIINFSFSSRESYLLWSNKSRNKFSAAELGKKSNFNRRTHLLLQRFIFSQRLQVVFFGGCSKKYLWNCLPCCQLV